MTSCGTAHRLDRYTSGDILGGGICNTHATYNITFDDARGPAVSGNEGR
jgi:23S rRNA-/tRNA-specific pseudouridylate synthase